MSGYLKTMTVGALYTSVAITLITSAERIHGRDKKTSFMTALLDHFHDVFPPATVLSFGVGMLGVGYILVLQGMH